MKTQLIEYYFTLPEDRTAYGETIKQIEMGGVPTLSGQEVELDTKHIFSDQWNTTDGRRVFDHHVENVPNERIKSGHYLVITEEMKRIRRETFQCGFCGAQYKHEGYCTACRGNEYLTPEHYHLLQLKDCTTRNHERDTLPAVVLAAVAKEQAEATRARRELRALRLRQQADKTIRSTNLRCKAETWVLKNTNIDTHNMIMYKEGVFTFGWRTPLSDKEEWALRGQLKKFPYTFEVKKC
jgi:hypothetical protein